jgi:predicted phosphodiesterase
MHLRALGHRTESEGGWSCVGHPPRQNPQGIEPTAQRLGVNAMTTLAILSDIHGNLPALHAVTEDLVRHSVDQVIVAGDCISCGPFTNEAVEELTANRSLAIRGNSEYYVLDYGSPRAPMGWGDSVRYALPAWLKQHISESSRAVVASWPDSLGLTFPEGPALRVVHGTPTTAWKGLFPQMPEEELRPHLADVREPCVLVGHTHLPMEWKAAGRHFCNPGSVGYPLDGIVHASYLILRSSPAGWEPTFRRVGYDRALVFREYARQDFVSHCGLLGTLVVEGFRQARPFVAAFLAWRDAHCADAPLTGDLYNRFEADGPCRYLERAYQVNL